MMSKNLLIYVLFAIYFVLTGSVRALDGSVLHFKDAAVSGFADINPSERLTVDLSGYDISENATLVVLQIFSNYYYLPINPDRKVYLFSKDSGQATKRSQQFKGLNRLDPVFVIIGRETFPGSLDVGLMISDKSIMVRVGM